MELAVAQHFAYFSVVLIVTLHMPIFEHAVCHYRLSRKTFDTADTYKEFGPIRIEFGKVS